MGEYINASIKFGGRLREQHVDELLELINEKRLGPDWDMVGEVTIDDLRATAFYGSSEVNYGNLDELQSFCAERGLYYEYECGAGSEWDGQTVFYDPTTEEEHDFVGEQDKAITLKQVKKLGSYEAVVAFFDTTLPPFEIVFATTPEELIELAKARGQAEGDDGFQYTRDIATDLYGELVRGEREGDAEAFKAKCWEELGYEPSA